MDWDGLFKKIVENQVVTCVLIICLTIAFCALIFGGYSCAQMENDYIYKMRIGR